MAARKRRGFSRTMAVSTIRNGRVYFCAGGLAHDLEVEADFGMGVEELFLR